MATVVLVAIALALRPGPRAPGERRGQRVGQVVRQELAAVIHRGTGARGLKDDIRQMISIVDVSMSSDLRSARVRVSTLGERLDTIRAMRWLQENRKFIRHELAQRLTHMRRIPELQFVDVDISSPVRVMKLIDDMAHEDQGRSGGLEPQDDDVDPLDDGVDFRDL